MSLPKRRLETSAGNLLRAFAQRIYSRQQRPGPSHPQEQTGEKTMLPRWDVPAHWQADSQAGWFNRPGTNPKT